ncbi:MAG: hypothetical protein IJ407_04580 [Clostridia bacterium]|nr:hypothetical protein [Clostridia bacterium]
MRKKVITGALMALILLFWIYIAALVPYTHDDWEWGIDAGLEQWLTGAVNNRFAGNFFVVIMTRSSLVKVLLMGAILFALPVLMAFLTEGGSFFARFLAGNLILLSLPLTVWRQTVGWVSGFANYCISSAMLLGWLLLLRRFLLAKKKTVLPALLLFFYTTVAGLFLENQTVLMLLVGLCLVGWALYRRQGRIMTFCTLAGAAVSCFFLFYNPLYTELNSTGTALNGIRTLAFPVDGTLWEALTALLSRYGIELLPELFRLSPAFCLMAVLLPLCCFLRSGKKRLMLLALWPAAHGLLCLFYPQAPAWSSALGACGSWAVAILSAAMSSDGWQRRVVLLLMAVFVVAPLAVVTETGERLFLLPFLLTALALLDAAAPLLNKKGLLSGCALLVCILMLRYGFIYHQVERSSRLRQELVAAAVEQGADSVILPTERWRIWWGRNPQTERYMECYREFYGIPQELTLIYLPAGSLEHWPEITQEDWEQRWVYSK